VNAPAFLPTALSILLIAVAGYAFWRLLAARALGLAADVETDLLLLCASVAGAGLLSDWARSLPRAVWEVLFATACCYFAAQALRARTDPRRHARAAAHACGSAILVYMFLAGVAPSTINGSTAGNYVMAGMPGMIVDNTITFPALGLVCVAAMTFYCAGVVARLKPAEGAAATEPRAGFPPRSVEACRVLITLALAYAILSKLV
jgi:hypothetical protein